MGVSSLPNYRNCRGYSCVGKEGSTLLLGLHFDSDSPEKPYAANSAGPKPGTITATKTVDQTRRPVAAIDGDVITLVTTVAQTAMGMKSDETEDFDFCHCHE
jgi:hypothetical protein